MCVLRLQYLFYKAFLTYGINNCELLEDFTNPNQPPIRSSQSTASQPPTQHLLSALSYPVPTVHLFSHHQVLFGKI